MNLDQETFKNWWNNEGLYKIDSTTDVYTMSLIAYCAGAQKGRSEIFEDFMSLTKDTLDICNTDTPFNKAANVIVTNLRNAIKSIKDIRDE